MGHCCGTLLWDTLKGHSCETLLRDTVAGHSCGTLLWDTHLEHSCGTLLCLVGHSCRRLLWDTLVRHSCGTLRDTLAGHSCKSPKRAFRTRLPQKLTCQSLQNDRFARDFLQKSSGNTHRSTHITQPCQAVSRFQPLQATPAHTPIPM